MDKLGLSSIMESVLLGMLRDMGQWTPLTISDRRLSPGKGHLNKTSCIIR